ncbi:MAG TPA: pyruvate dehydrogenase (acetyl-transferring) E1 component subunit alpha [Thermoanaerobaculia bacterium]|nr:pyruvate dehydrogenase (acetyl-transferring) E1 component subunit alpha [Thermoanaerobaculia bacterium]
MTTQIFPAAPDVEHEHGRHLLREMLRIRRFEEKCAELYSASKIRGFLHLYIGEEAIAVGAFQALTPEDGIVATYREHGHALARGVPARPIMAEMFGKVEGCSRGRGGSMHIFDASRRFYGGNAIVGGGLPLAVGLALADKIAGRRRLTACFFGEGAVAEGEFHESMNLAALWKLPVLFCCENNLYAMGTALERSEAEVDLCLKARGYEVPAEPVDGMDVLAVEAATRRASDAVRSGKGPFFLEFRSYRFRAHSMYDPELYRDKAEVESWKKRDPIPALQQILEKAGELTAQDLSRMESEIADEIADAVAFAEAARPEPVEELTRFVCSDAWTRPAANAPSGEKRRVTYREAIREALREALNKDPRVFVMGEDVGRYGGCYAVTKGLLEEFGPERIRDTPLSESAFVGAGIGAALGGLRPIVEIMTVNFSLLALDQILNNAATLLHMSGGQLPVPLVIRMTTGAGRQLGAQHSHSLEGWYAHIPGLRILAPATLEDARGMLASALSCPDPVIVFEHGSLYNMEGDLDANAGPVDIERTAVRRPGRDVTLISYGGMLGRTLEAANMLAAEGIEAEVLDLRVLRPLDTKTILESVRRTHRAVIVDEGWKTGSLSAEIVARIVEGAFYDLDAPTERVCSAEVPMPYARHLEEAALPQAATIAEKVRGMISRRG